MGYEGYGLSGMGYGVWEQSPIPITPYTKREPQVIQTPIPNTPYPYTEPQGLQSPIPNTQFKKKLT